MSEAITALEACDQIEGAMNALAQETRYGPWEWNYTVPHSDEEHIENMKETLRKTRDHFSLEGDSKMWFVSNGESGAILSQCGNSPTAEARSRYISFCSPKNIMSLIDRIRELEAR